MLRLRWQDRPVEFGRQRPIIIRVETIRVRLVVIIPVMPAAVTQVVTIRAATIPTIIPRLTTHRMAAAVSITVRRDYLKPYFVNLPLFKSLVIYL